MAIIISRTSTGLVLGAGTISTSTSSATVTGFLSLFNSEVAYVGKAIYTAAGVYIGTVSSINSNTSITLTANAAVAVTGATYRIGYLPKNLPLTNAEIDTNFINLNNSKLELSDTSTLNLPNTVVKRDGSGNFSAGTITANLSGNATSADQSDISDSLNTANNYQVNSLGVNTAPSGTAGEIRATNAITSYYSDERLKTEVSKIENALDKIDQLTGIIYTQNELAEQFGYNNYEEQVGLYAQHVQKVQPQAVKPAPFDIDVLEDGTEVSKTGQNYLTVQYEKLIPLLVEGIKELRKEIKELKGVK